MFSLCFIIIMTIKVDDFDVRKNEPGNPKGKIGTSIEIILDLWLKEYQIRWR